jgi:hypothetical protein
LLRLKEGQMDPLEAQDRTRKDWARRPASAAFWWGLPLMIGVASNALRLPLDAAAWLWSVVMTWMGIGCLLNAQRCRRLHCFIAGPAFLAGAVVAALIAGGLIDMGPHALSYVTLIVFVLALLSFVPEAIWRRYA